MERLNSLNIFDPNLVSTVIRDYERDIRQRLIDGDTVYINGVGKLVCKYRNVKNDSGRNYTVRVKVIQDTDFSNDLISEYNKDNTKYKRK